MSRVMGFQNYLEALDPSVSAQVGSFYNYPVGPAPRINPYAYSGMSRRDAPGDQLYADLIRAQTQDYLYRFAPQEEFLAGQITPTGTKSLQGDLDRTRQSVIGAGLNVRAQQQRANERLGISGGPGLANQNSTVSALVGGLNDTRLRDQDRRMALLTGAGGSIAQKARSNQ
tara:strand:- start:110 stop:622 length:513 start_codon:yes stop_codon:yes gene_type:complete